jgi:ribosomal protein L32
VSTLTECRTCSESKPLSDFYADSKRAGGHFPDCKACHNAKPKKATDTRVTRNRARHRAVADLIDRHAVEFESLLAARLEEAQQEAAVLATDAKAREHYRDEPVRLRPGARMSGEKAGDRIDVARCPHCVKHHDRGHVCTKCGTAPASALRLPDDGEVDEIAVERAMGGDAVRLTRSEQVEVVRRLADRGLSDAEIAKRLHVTAKTVERRRADYGIASRWTA